MHNQQAKANYMNKP